LRCAYFLLFVIMCGAADFDLDSGCTESRKD
jgi:hypothetical protein